EFGGKFPRTVEELRNLPGVGRYTAGAIASIAFGIRAPILDGNVTRVLCRLDGIEDSPADKEVSKRLWRRAEELLPPSNPGDFNSALMELGALICTPRSPACLICPLKTGCSALAQGKTASIPPVRKAKSRPLISRWTCCVRKGSKWLIEK